MNFFEHQERARRNTQWLLVYFVLAVIGIVVVLDGIAALATGQNPFDPGMLAMIAGGVVVVVALGALFRIAELSRGGSVVAELLGGRQIDPHTTDLRETQLRNIVEEMSIASGVPAPDVYVLDHEPGINAFAAGNAPGDAVVAVTRGTLESLSRDELQGVVAHEFSHILNGDMRLNLRLMGVLNGILLLAILGRILTRTGFWTGGRERSSGDGGRGGVQISMFAAGVALFLVGSIGVFFARLIKAAVSRQREFLADASAVQFTRNPSGIAGALHKIGQASSRLDTPRADEASHMFFGNGMGAAFMQALATHPPIEERIRAIDPNFDPRSVAELRPPPLPETAPAARDWTATAGAPQTRHLVLAAAVLAAMPEFTRAASRETAGAVTLIYALLLSADAATRRRQLAAIDASDAERKQVEQDLAKRDQIRPDDWLATVDLCLPALRKLSEPQYRTFRANVRTLVEADGRIDLFEYVLQKALMRHLDVYFIRANPPAVRHHSVAALLAECATVLSALAFFDYSADAERDAAFAEGVKALGADAAAMRRVTEMRLAEVDRALDRLAQADGPAKKLILTACGRVVMENERAEPREEALLRAVADTLDTPIPPFVARAGA